LAVTKSRQPATEFPGLTDIAVNVDGKTLTYAVAAIVPVILCPTNVEPAVGWDADASASSPSAAKA
jgi:hypothetical protein